MNKPAAKNESGNQMRLDAEHVFRFNCSPSVTCFTQCCQDVTIVLTPYDVLRLKNAVGMSSEEFLNKYTVVVRQKDCLIPMVVLKMNEQDKRCLFVTEKGCAVYTDRPWPCRMYPLDMNDDGTFRMITEPSRCHGLKVEDKWPICEWLVEQGVPIYDQMNSLFSEITGPLRAMDLDIDNPQIYQMTFMALYNLDKFKDFIFRSTFLDRFDIDSLKIEKLKRNDLDLLKFGFEWIKFGVFGQKLFQVKQDALKKDGRS